MQEWFASYLSSRTQFVQIECSRSSLHGLTVLGPLLYVLHTSRVADIIKRHNLMGSCVLKASVDRVSVDTIGRYGDRHSADISTDTRPICRPSVGPVSVDMNRQACRPTPGRYFTATRPPLGRHSADTLPTLALSSLANWSALAAEFYLPYSTERDFQWPSSFFLSFNSGNIHVFFPAMFFPRHRFYIRPSLLSDAAAFGDCCFWRLVILGEQKMI